MTSFHPTRNWGEGVKPATDFAPSQGQQNVFFPSNYPLHYLRCYHVWSLEHVWLQKIRLKGSHNSEWLLKGLSETIWTKSFGRNDVIKRGLAADYCSKWRLDGKLWASLETETSVSGYT